MPKAIGSLLNSSVFAFLARLILVVTFVVPGIMQVLQYKHAVGEFAFFHLSPPGAFVIASAVTLLVGSLLVIIGGRLTWLGAGALGIYTGLTILIVHHFWTMAEPDRTNEMRTALEHISLIGGLMVVAILEARGGSPRGR